MQKKNLWQRPYRAIIHCWVLLVCCTHPARAQSIDSITVQFNKSSFNQGDTISFEINLENYRMVSKAATIQLWVEQIKTGRRWKFRYPLVNGYVNARLKIDSNMKDGAYAFNFLLQKSFFTISGRLQNNDKKHRRLNYVIISKNKQTLMDTAVVKDDQSFALHNLLFQDSAFIIFSKPMQKNNDLFVHIKTPLDSAFTPAAVCTKFITLGKATVETATNAPVVPGYIFKADSTKYRIMLPEVVVKSRSNKREEDFEKENVTGLFSGSDAIVFDGLGSDDIANAPDLFTYLATRVGGLKLETDDASANRSFTWRGQPTDIFLNEIKLDPEVPFWINPSDIAIIKVFRPGTSLSAGSGAGGAIAIYTKTGDYGKSTTRNYSFYITGYTGLDAEWK